MLQQQIIIEAIAQEDASSKYHVRTDGQGHPLSRPIFYTEIPVCWSKDPDHNIVISAFVWGNEVQNDNPTAEEIGLFALRAAEIKKGDIVLLTGRLCGTADGMLTLVDEQKVTTAANLQMTIQGFAITGNTNARSLDLHPLQQTVFFEAFVGADAKADYTKNNTFFAKFTACWSRGPEEKLWFDATVWGRKVTSDKPTTEEAGSFAVWIAENVKEGDRVLLIGRLAGSKDGRANLYTKGREVRALISGYVGQFSLHHRKESQPRGQACAGGSRYTFAGNRNPCGALGPSRRARVIQPSSAGSTHNP